MARLARWCFEHRWKVVAAWLLALAAIAGASAAAGTDFTTNLSLPGTDSQAAASLLATNFPAAAGESDQVVIQAGNGATIRSAAVRSAVIAALARAAAVPGVANVASPYAPDGVDQISSDGTVAFARVAWAKPSDQITVADAKSLINAAESAAGPDVHVSLGGPAITNSERVGLGRTVVDTEGQDGGAPARSTRNAHRRGGRRRGRGSRRATLRPTSCAIISATGRAAGVTPWHKCDGLQPYR